jgi:hypothetical protein
MTKRQINNGTQHTAGYFLLLIVYGKEIHLKTNMYSHLSKVLGNVKKNPYIINQNHIFSKKYCEVISG